MSEDQVHDLYFRHGFQYPTQENCRNRIHWMCSQVHGHQILDAGCSQGVVSILLGRTGHNVIGADVNPNAIAFANEQLASESESVRGLVKFEHVPSDRLPYDDHSFDTVIFGEVIEHLLYPQTVLKELHRVLRPGGTVIITTPFGVHPHVEHVQTFGLHTFLTTVGTHFETRSIDVGGKYIRFVGTARDIPLTSTDVREPLLKISEAAFIESEHRYLETIANQKNAYERLQEAQKSRRSSDSSMQAQMNAANQRIAQWNRDCQKGIAELCQAVDRCEQSKFKLGRLGRKIRKLRHSAANVSPQMILEAYIELLEELPELAAKTEREQHLQRQKLALTNSQETIRQLRTRCTELQNSKRKAQKEAGASRRSLGFRTGKLLTQIAFLPVAATRAIGTFFTQRSAAARTKVRTVTADATSLSTAARPARLAETPPSKTPPSLTGSAVQPTNATKNQAANAS